MPLLRNHDGYEESQSLFQLQVSLLSCRSLPYLTYHPWSQRRLLLRQSLGHAQLLNPATDRLSTCSPRTVKRYTGRQLTKPFARVTPLNSVRGSGEMKKKKKSSRRKCSDAGSRFGLLRSSLVCPSLWIWRTISGIATSLTCMSTSQRQ